MSWNLEGKTLVGLYLGAWPYRGVVESSRVKYGGKVQHTVRVEEPFRLYGEIREIVLIEDNYRICDDNEQKEVK